MVWSKAVERIAVATLLCASQWGMPRAQERPAILESVDLVVPVAPATVVVAGTTHIVYELHISNFLPVEVSITRIQVKRVGSSDA